MFRISLILASVIFLSACSTLSDKPWNETVPENTIAIFVPEQQTTLKTLLESTTGSFFDDITASALPVLSDLEVAARKLLTVESVFFYPAESDQLQTIWVLQNESDLMDTFRSYFARPLFVDEYRFKGKVIYKLSIENRILFALETSSLMYASESSQALEAIVSTSIEDSPALTVSSIKRNSLVLNLKQLDNLLTGYAAIKYFPLIHDGFNGFGSGTITFEEKNLESLSFSLSGAITLDGEAAPLANALSTGNEIITLDQYVPTDAATFTVLFSKPEPQPVLNPVSPLDSALRLSPSLGKELANALDNELAFVGFAPAGLTGVGENLYIRKIKDTRAVYDWLRELSRLDIISSSDNAYYIRSSYLAQLISSGLSTYETFYLGVTSEGLVISPRLGLTNRVRSDRSRRRVIAYNQTFLDIKNELGDTQSGLFYVDSRLFTSYIQSYLNPSASLAAFTSKFEILAGALQLSPDREQLQLTVNGYTKKRSTQPFEEQWIAPMDGATITGKPILADIGGSSREEIVVANSMNRVLGIANDGTIYFSAETGSDTPIGSPVVYDWYGNGQKAIMVAAGNKVYAWNTTGSPLPKFPFVMNENITAPLLVNDINRDGIPEVIVTTADRQIHALDGRGEPLKGWPVTTSAEVQFKPYFERIAGNWTLFAQADNGLYGFDALGRLRDGYPVFISAAFSSDPSTINDGLMMGASDGHIYRLGSSRMFQDSLNVMRNTAYDSLAPSLRLSSMYLSNAPINAAPLFANKLQIKTDSITVYTESMLIYQSANGAIFVTNQQGDLRFTTNMGQPASNTSDLILADLQKDGKPELLAVAGFGRLYAWELYKGYRYYDLPTSAIEYPMLTDLEGDGYPELIGQTRGGLRCWTLYGKAETPEE
ncbi:hypothetical protein EP331_01925 [bacterium]|nr:MAG: hypothetical protein EP331_01925 [bacterium]